MKQANLRTERATYSWGPQKIADDQVRFRLWAPDCQSISVQIGDRDLSMQNAGDGWHEIVANGVTPGCEYLFLLPDGSVVPDPASRRQAGDVHGPSVVVDHSAYRWTNLEWQGRPWEQAVIYELHMGTFTAEGTFRAAIEKLHLLSELGITAVEVMPVAQFGGRRGWGYDGTLLFAPHNEYGTPEDMKAFVDAAHGYGIMVFLDVVYNHFGPEGNYIGNYASAFFDPARQTPWGSAINFSQPAVRDFFIDNALYWLAEFRLDGLRFDAVDHLADNESEVEILVELGQRIRAAFPEREIHLTTEDNRNVTYLHRRESGLLHTAEWNDDFHSVAHVIATGETEGHYKDFVADRWTKLARALAEGYVYQGEISSLSGRPRGERSAGLPPVAFVDFLQNHDQIGNRALGERLTCLTNQEMLKAFTSILMLSPQMPLLFMGQEWGETQPFQFFTDFSGELADAVREGRRREFANFSAFNKCESGTDTIPDPNDPGTFRNSKINWHGREEGKGRAWLLFFRELITLRRTHIVPLLETTGGSAGRILKAQDGAVAVEWQLSETAILRLFANLSDDRREFDSLPRNPLFSCVPADLEVNETSLPPLSVVVALEQESRKA
ncbi:malto-oligosyltrehalose trehalohydrolase [Phyllobacterium endophyticum]|uniref:Malto-oligosyltrehalose trehalohydrolase n=1 Tax=Phyllobacterium endophyticum TaxID=1149773 RepID=A0A2P7ANU3_9HYPH|nr:malto-oligosyltrehalose trehalohydrolase [Phyllobacterium endophyticum]MBB3233776.1 malto-oligosyltrehalose trehalohydrolase [Phyllobacterium endophyticum]PSH55885.1 malto-oligosyltrehalose trehalohydrolase [Phyllobacterium endophyticum]TYR41025.1 malto-oligosyltrehalose trehalohydrolase [Phyllobacterium endophyticum]